MKFYMPFEKVEAQDDGTVKVSGYASSETKDSHGETIKADAMRAAIPDYMSFGGTGALREMHQPIAAGVVLKAEVEADGRTHIETHVVDQNSAKKVLAGVFKGFSIGGKVTEKEGTIIKGLQLREISLVDRPANPDAKFTIMKMDDEPAPVTSDDLKKVADDADTRLAKLDDTISTLTKSVGDLTSAIAKQGSESAEIIKSLTARLDTVEKAAAPPKGAISTLSKSVDSSGKPEPLSQDEMLATLAKMSEGERAMLVMKASLNNPLTGR